jgi:hypothetical protein
MVGLQNTHLPSYFSLNVAMFIYLITNKKYWSMKYLKYLGFYLCIQAFSLLSLLIYSEKITWIIERILKTRLLYAIILVAFFSIAFIKVQKKIIKLTNINYVYYFSLVVAIFTSFFNRLGYILILVSILMILHKKINKKINFIFIITYFFIILLTALSTGYLNLRIRNHLAAMPLTIFLLIYLIYQIPSRIQSFSNVILYQL